MQPPSKVLIVDDRKIGQDILADLLSTEDYKLDFASSGYEALEKAEQFIPDIILLDVMMPGMDGFETCRRLRSNPRTEQVPVIMVTALDDQNSRLLGIEAGADDFVSKPFHRAELRARIRTITRLNRYRRLLEERSRYEQLFEHAPDGIMILDGMGAVQLANPSMLSFLGLLSRESLVGKKISDFIAPSRAAEFQNVLQVLFTSETRKESLETIFLNAASEPAYVEVSLVKMEWQSEAYLQVIVRNMSERKLTDEGLRSANEQLSQANFDLRSAYQKTIEGWAFALELRDWESEEHSTRVRVWTVRLARQFGFSNEDLEHVTRGATLHDIGKMGLSDSILLKRGPLSDEEWSEMRKHPEYARRLLSAIDFLKPAMDIPYYHHERWDGSGYPLGLKGERIPLAARIFAVVDVWDVLLYDRPYRKAWPAESVVNYLKDQSGKQFDPQVVSSFLALLEEEKQKQL